MKQDDEYTIVEPGTKKSWLIFLFSYVIFLLWMEPLIDLLMSFFPPGPDPAEISIYNQQKGYITTVAFGAARTFPILIFIWFGWRVIQNEQMPPSNIKLPVSIKIIRHQKARMAGMLIITTGLLLVLREVSLLSTTSTIL